MNEYERGYQAGYAACVEQYKKRDLILLKKNYVFEETYFLRRSDFMSRFNPADRELKTYIDLQTFKKQVKTSRKVIEVLNLGDWYVIKETGFTFSLNDYTAGIGGIEEQIISYIIDHYKKKYLTNSCKN